MCRRGAGAADGVDDPLMREAVRPRGRPLLAHPARGRVLQAGVRVERRGALHGDDDDGVHYGGGGTLSRVASLCCCPYMQLAHSAGII